MELRTIKTFHTIVKLGSFQKAAATLNYSQPTITMRIKQLESELNVQLFDRGKVLQVTEAGRLFFERSDRLLAEYDVLDNTISDLQNGEAGLIQIGISEPTASLVFPDILAQFLRDYPKMSVNVSVDDANTCNRKLLADDIDFAICGAPEVTMDTYFEPLFSDKLDILLPDRHPLATQASVTLKALKDECFIFTPANCPIRIRIEQALQKEIGNTYRRMELTSSMAHKYYVKAGIGVSIFTHTAHSASPEGTRAVPIRDLDICPPIGLLTKKRRVPLSRVTNELIHRTVNALKMSAGAEV